MDMELDFIDFDTPLDPRMVVPYAISVNYNTGNPDLVALREFYDREDTDGSLGRMALEQMRGRPF